MLIQFQFMTFFIDTPISSSSLYVVVYECMLNKSGMNAIDLFSVCAIDQATPAAPLASGGRDSYYILLEGPQL